MFGIYTNMTLQTFSLSSDSLRKKKKQLVFFSSRRVACLARVFSAYSSKTAISSPSFPTAQHSRSMCRPPTADCVNSMNWLRSVFLTLSLRQKSGQTEAKTATAQECRYELAILVTQSQCWLPAESTVSAAEVWFSQRSLRSRASRPDSRLVC